jgi:S-adenosylmethionine hydrolase
MTVPFTLTYGEVQRGRVAVCEDSFRTVTVAVNQGSASAALKARRGDPVVLARVQVDATGIPSQATR